MMEGKAGRLSAADILGVGQGCFHEVHRFFRKQGTVTDGQYQ